MKLLYLWVENYYGRIENQEFCFCSSHRINYDIESSLLHISINGEYIDNFYGNNILDISAIVGQNGSGKTTISRCLYDLCKSVHPVSETENDYITKHIVVYATGTVGSPQSIIIHYYLSNELKIEASEKMEIIMVNSMGLQSDSFEQAIRQHDMTTVYFTNSFEVNHVLTNQGPTEYSEGLKHKSLVFSPMLSLNRASASIKKHYGAKEKDGRGLLDVINRYSEQMSIDSKITYATATSYNFFTVMRYCPESIIELLPAMSNFELSIIEFGAYVEFETQLLRLSQFDQTVLFIRKNIYDHIIVNFRGNYWEQIYANLLCEIVLFLNVFNGDYRNVKFDVLDEASNSIKSDKALESLFLQIQDSEEKLAKKELIRKIRNVETVDLDILREFISLSDGNSRILSSTLWYQQVLNFLESYNDTKKIQINRTIDLGCVELIEFLVNHNENVETIYGRMLNVKPMPMSSGEIALINIFSAIYTALNTYTSDSILLIIDEFDAFLHPKWQQEILMHITKWINESEAFNEKKVQLIIATHSPITLSDLTADRIIYIEKPCKVKGCTNLTFGANINSLFYDSFIMEQGNIGLIAKTKIQNAIDVLNGKYVEQNELDEVIYTIDAIGERFIREKLKSHPIYIAEQRKRQGDV